MNNTEVNINNENTPTLTQGAIISEDEEASPSGDYNEDTLNSGSLQSSKEIQKNETEPSDPILETSSELPKESSSSNYEKMQNNAAELSDPTPEATDGKEDSNRVQSIQTSTNSQTKTIVNTETTVEEKNTKLIVEERQKKETVNTSTQTSITEQPTNPPSVPQKELNDNLIIYGVSSVAVLIILVLISKSIFGRKSSVKPKFTQKDLDFLELIYGLDEIYKKTDEYLDKSSKN